MAKKDNSSFEQKLFKAADKLRKNIDAAEYKHVVLGLVFLKYISESFTELYNKLEADEWSDPEDRDEYIAENVFFVPKEARWSHIHSQAKLPTIGQTIDEAMEAIEKENKELKNVLPQVYGKANLDKTSLGELIDLISNTELQAENQNSKDLFGRVYEYFLGEFANAEGKKGGQFYTPKAIVKLMVEMIEPYKGRVYDPASGSGGMFVMSEKFVTEHSGSVKDITVYGQESNQTTWKLSKMNLAIRNINSKFVAWNTEGSFLKDAHPDLKADFILANPPFNQKEWGVDILQEDGRWKYGTPPNGNANFGWMQHMLYHLSPRGVMATVLSNGSLSSNTSGEGDIRKNLVEADLVECIVALPKQLFYNTGIPACIWFLRRTKPALNPSQREGDKLNYRGGFNFSGLLNDAKQLRKNQTKAEEMFWELVSNKKFGGLKFRRQHQIGDYIVDFYCHSQKLIIEFDGKIHDTEERKIKDKKRDAYLTSIGNKVLRFENEELLNNPEKVLEYIASISPSGRDEREGKQNKILFIDASEMGYMKDRVHRNLSDADDKEKKGDFHENGWGDIQKIAETYHNWRKGENYENVKGFCKSATIKDIQKHAYVLTPGRYVGIPDEIDDGIPFEDKMADLTATLKQQMDKEVELNQEIETQLAKIGFSL